MRQIWAVLLVAACLAPSTAPAQAATGTQSSTERDATAPDAVRCRKIAVTGSLVKKDRICKTNAEWAVSADGKARDARDLVERNRPFFDCRGSTSGC